jgi:hypothetical protein
VRKSPVPFFANKIIRFIAITSFKATHKFEINVIPYL